MNSLDIILSEDQQKLIALMQFSDLKSACRTLSISAETLLSWQRDRNFRLALEAAEDMLRQDAMRQVMRNVLDLMSFYRSFQENLSMNERTEFLSSIVKLIKQAETPDEWDNSFKRMDDAADAARWRRANEEDEEEEEYFEESPEYQAFLDRKERERQTTQLEESDDDEPEEEPAHYPDGNQVRQPAWKPASEPGEAPREPYPPHPPEADSDDEQRCYAIDLRRWDDDWDGNYSGRRKW